MHTKFLLENLKGTDHSEDLGINGRIISECILGKYVRKVQTAFIWPRTGTSGRLL
jgi:hypothetical protein